MQLLDATLDREAVLAVRADLHADDAAVEARARAIVREVAERGEAAVLSYTEALDGARLGSVRLDDAAWDGLAARATPEMQRILARAAERIRAFHLPQRAESYRVGSCRQLVRPLDVVGLYVPGGRASYPSTVLMNAIPAAVAGVPRICMATPPRRDGTIDPNVAAAARLAGVHEIYLMGGAQAVAAFAYGAGAVPRVDRICGPGNAWVAAAKRIVAGRVGVDMEAGPSEVLVLADATTDPTRIARDLVAQAEHDPRALCLCVCTDRSVAEAAVAAVRELLVSEPNPIAAESLAARGAVIVARDLDEAIVLVNELAPEHLELSVASPEAVLPRIRAAGAIFLGEHAPAPIGDYLAGPNHTLPTSGCARFQSPLGVYDFQKRLNVVSWGPDELADLGPDVATFARAEGLVGHARAVEVRLPPADGRRPADAGPSDPGSGQRAATPGSGQRDPADAARPEVRRQRAYTLEPPPGPVVKLDQNEAPEDLPAELKDRILARFAAIPWNRYPAFDPTPWRERIAAHAGWKPEGVLLGNGSNEELELLFRAVVRPGDRVVLPVPCFSLYPLQLDALGAELVKVPLAGPDFAFDVDAIVAAARGARMVVLASPNNPTGTALPAGAVDRLLDTGALVVVDEAYREFSDQDLASRLGDDVPLVLLRTFSKAWAAAALRFGWLMGPPSLCHELHKIALPYNVSALTLAAVDALLDEPALLAERVAGVRAERERVAAGIAALGLRPVPTAANFVLFATAPHAPREVFARLRELGVLVRDVSSAVPGHLRVGVGSTADDDAFLASLERAL